MLTEQAAQIRMLLRSGELAEIGGRPQGSAAVSEATPRTLHLVLAFTAIYLIWGSTYLAIRFAIESIPPLLMMGLRHLTAGLLLYCWVRLRGIPAPLLKHWKPAAIAGALFFLGGHGTLAWAEQQVPSGLAALLCATLPLWIVLLTRLTGQKHKLPLSVVSGVLLGFLGVTLLIGPAALHPASGVGLIGFAMALMGALLWAVGTIYTQHVEWPTSSSLSAAMQMIAGGVSLGVAGLLTGEYGRVHPGALTAKSVLSLAYLTIFGSLIAFSAFTWLHKVSSPTKNSTYAYVNPVVAVFLGWFLADEAIGTRTLLATVIILAGVALVSRKAEHHHQVEPQSVRMSEADEELCGAD